MTRSHWAGSTSGAKPSLPTSATPALLWSTSSRPNCSTAAATSAPHCSASETSVCCAIASPPAPWISATVAAAPSSSTSPTTTWAPAAASATALARPSPEPPPVTIATLPSSCIGVPVRRAGSEHPADGDSTGRRECCRRSGPLGGGDPELGDVHRAAPSVARERDRALASHPEALGDGDRRRVVVLGEGAHAVESQRAERLVQRGTRALGGIPPAPHVRVEAPADFHRRQDRRIERRDRDAHVPDDAARGALGREPARNPAGFVLVDLRGQERGGLVARER